MIFIYAEARTAKRKAFEHSCCAFSRCFGYIRLLSVYSGHEGFTFFLSCGSLSLEFLRIRVSVWHVSAAFIYSGASIISRWGELCASGSPRLGEWTASFGKRVFGIEEMAGTCLGCDQGRILGTQVEILDSW